MHQQQLHLPIVQAEAKPPTRSAGFVCMQHFQSAGELTRLFEVLTGYQLLGFQLAPGRVTGTLMCSVLSDKAFALSYCLSQDMIFSGLRNLDLSAFGAASPLNNQGANTVPLFWKNKTMPAGLIGGFQLSETQSHYRLSAHHQHSLLIVKRSAVMEHLDRPENRVVLDYMNAANSALVPQKLHRQFLHYCSLGVVMPELTRLWSCPVCQLIELLNDASYGHALPSAQLLPSSQVLLQKMFGLKQAIFSGLNAGELADAVGLGRTQLNAACQEVFGCSPKEFLKSVRLEEAMLLLRSPAERNLAGLKTIEDVHNHVGISSNSSFRKSFNQWFEASPRKFWVD